jgi:hypothetical protein
VNKNQVHRQRGLAVALAEVPNAKASGCVHAHNDKNTVETRQSRRFGSRWALSFIPQCKQINQINPMNTHEYF